MWLLFLPILAVVALVIALGGVIGGLFWMMGSAWPLLLICLGMWLLWRGDGLRHQHDNHRRHASRGWMASPRKEARQQPSSTPQTRPEKSPVAKIELPIDIQVKVEQIHRKVDVLLGFADRFPPFSQDLYLVRQTASDYLPRTINTFLSLPRDAVDTPMATGGGTPREELKAQLDLLDRKLDEIAQDLQRQDADRLLANRRFLESRFGARAERHILTESGPGAEVA
jgi:hypothetical protein